MECRCGSTAPSTRVTGRIIKQADRAHSGMPREMSIKAISRMTKQTDTESTCAQMVQDMRETGLMMRRKDKDKRTGPTVLVTKATTKMA